MKFEVGKAFKTAVGFLLQVFILSFMILSIILLLAFYAGLYIDNVEKLLLVMLSIGFASFLVIMTNDRCKE